eukprot:593875-Pelagomonas_calceolata.AAC.2
MPIAPAVPGSHPLRLSDLLYYNNGQQTAGGSREQKDIGNCASVNQRKPVVDLDTHLAGYAVSCVRMRVHNRCLGSMGQKLGLPKTTTALLLGSPLHRRSGICSRNERSLAPRAVLE